MDGNNESSHRTFDLEERLPQYATGIIRLVETFTRSRAGNHVADQLLRSGTAALPNHGKAQAAESAADFAHKISLCLKELRESHRWLLLSRRVPLVDSDELLAPLIAEIQELIRIFKASLRTIQKRQLTRSKRKTLDSEP
jgi:four helix bundle protein